MCASQRHLFSALLLLECGAWPGALQAADLAAPEAEREMVVLSNAFRSQHGLAALRPQPALMHAARSFADYMAKTDRYGHTADGREPEQRVDATRYAPCMVAENIAWQYRSDGFSSATLARTMVNGWIASPPHRRNLLSPELTDIAVAVAHSATSGRWYAVQMMARPQTLQIRFDLSNDSAQTIRYVFDGREFELLPGVTRWHESCSGQPLEVRLPDQADSWRVQPQAGARYRIGADPGKRGWRVDSE